MMLLALGLFAPLVFLAWALVQSDPVLQPGAWQILAMVGTALPVFSRYVVEWLRKWSPDLAEIDGRAMSRNLGVGLFVLFATTGLASAPEIILPAAPLSYDLLDWLGYASALLGAGLAGIAYVVSGSRVVHTILKGDSAPSSP